MAIANLENKIVFITGAASGIGAATARVFAEQNCQLVVADLSLDLLDETVATVRQLGCRAHAVALDVTDEDRFNKVALEVSDTIGVPHVLVNNAGIGAFGSFLNTPMQVVRQILEVNLYGVINGCHAFLPLMLESDDPRHLVNVASLASISPMPNMSAYAASKYAVDGLTEVISMELADSNIDITCVHPGVINTPIAQGKSYNPGDNTAQLQRLSSYYQENGSDPRVVGEGILKAVQKGCAHLYAGAKAPETALLKRISPSLTRKVTMKTAHTVGYA